MGHVNFVKIAWFGKHFGEEPPLVFSKMAEEKKINVVNQKIYLKQQKGAGTIFFTGCNLRCVYCQNYQISQQNIGKNYSIEEFVKIMLGLQNDGALNIDLVSPTIWTEQIIKAIKEAKKQGLNIPIVWNSNAYEGAELIKKLKGLIDVYLPDFKYGNDDFAFKYSGVRNYVEKAEESIREMFLQVGNLKLSKDGTAKRGIIVRHLILPGNMDNSFSVLERIKKINKDIYVSLMSQYEPIFKAKDFPEINRRLNRDEFEKIYAYRLGLGLENGWVQEPESHDAFLPDFTKENPFE